MPSPSLAMILKLSIPVVSKQMSIKSNDALPHFVVFKLYTNTSFAVMLNVSVVPYSVSLAISGLPEF